MPIRGALVACFALLTFASVASANPATDLVDATVAQWLSLQTRAGTFIDPSTGHASKGSGDVGYGGIMIGDGMMRSGVRKHDRALVLAGIRAVSAALGVAPRDRGVFDGLAFASAYNFARASLGSDAAFVRVRRRWERYLEQLGAPKIGTFARDCVLSPACFHNHEAVEGAEDAELLATGLRSPLRGTKLHDRGALLRAARAEIGSNEPRFARGDGRTVGATRRSGLALLSDSGSFALAYDGLSTAMLADSIARLGRRAPGAALATLRRTTDALAGFMGPDGDVAYIGRRQEEAWADGGAAAAGAIAATVLPAKGQNVNLAQRAITRLASVYGVDSNGLRVVPRRGRGETGGRGIDADWLDFNAVTVFFLDLAAGALDRERAVQPAPLTADRSGGAFVEQSQLGFSAVRQGDVWFAVHRHAFNGDLRYDFGLVAAKWRRPDGSWQDILRPRPYVFNRAASAGPIIERGGRRWLPYGDRIRVGVRGAVVVSGGFSDTSGHRLRGATFRYTPTARGVTVTFPVRRGDTLLFTTYLSAGDGFRLGDGVADRVSIATASPRPATIRSRGGLSSCCDIHMDAFEAVVRVRRNGVAAYSVAAR